jgi:hypothetical protein
MNIASFVLFALLYMHATSKAWCLVVRPNASTQEHQEHQMIQNQSQDIAVLLAAHRNELIHLGRLDGLDLTNKNWSYKQVEICPSFSKHTFVRYWEAGEPNADFIAVFPRVEGGKTRLVRQGIGPDAASRFASIRTSTIAAFNTVWAEERNGVNSKKIASNIDWVNMANCYAEFAGEHPVNLPNQLKNTQDEGDPGYLNSGHQRVLIVAIEVRGKTSQVTRLALSFNKRGFITRVTRVESDK